MSTAFTDSDLQSLASSDSESTNRGSPKSEFGLALGAGDTELWDGAALKVELAATKAAMSQLEQHHLSLEQHLHTVSHDHEETVRRLVSGHEETIRKITQDREESNRRLVQDVAAVMSKEK